MTSCALTRASQPRVVQPPPDSNHLLNPNNQRLRSNVGTPMSTVSTLLVPTLALTLLLAQCANTFCACCWHTVRTCVRCEQQRTSEFERFLSDFERFLEEITHSSVAKSVLTPSELAVSTPCANTSGNLLLARANTSPECCWHRVC